MTSTAVPKLLLTVEEAAQAMRLGRTLTYRYVQTGELRSVKLGRARRIPVAALEDFVQRLQAEQMDEAAL